MTATTSAAGLGVAALSPEGFIQHPLHRDESVWSNTNCVAWAVAATAAVRSGSGACPRPCSSSIHT
ncbi:MAG: hypothetical protein L0G19_08585, partial [Micrococcales bacterium]|nr:hypothetical protein [Micrococcales bacterium]